MDEMELEVVLVDGAVRPHRALTSLKEMLPDQIARGTRAVYPCVQKR